MEIITTEMQAALDADLSASIKGLSLAVHACVDERASLRAERDALLQQLEASQAIAATRLIKMGSFAGQIAELRAVLGDIVFTYHNTYDAESDSTGRWTSAASIPVEVMNRAQKLLESK